MYFARSNIRVLTEKQFGKIKAVARPSGRASVARLTTPSLTVGLPPCLPPSIYYLEGPREAIV